MNLIEKMAEKYKERLVELFREEELNDNYLNQNAFKNCKQRAQAGLGSILDEQTNMLTLGIALHRESYHNENYETEKKLTSVALGEETTKEVEASAFWSAG